MFGTDDGATLDSWLKTLDADLADNAPLTSALDLLGRGMGGWVASKTWESREKDHPLPDGRVRTNALRVLDFISRWDPHQASAEEVRASEARLRETVDLDVMCVALLADVPMPGNQAYFAMDRLEESPDARSLHSLRAARHILTSRQYPGDANPTNDIVRRIDALVARIEEQQATRR